jgi:glycosyltransferase involved in cell wall biosynthesis
MISGVSMVVQHLADEMVTRGHDILVLAASETGKRYVTEGSHLKVVRLKSIFNPFRNNQHFIPWAYADIFEDLKAFSPEVIHLHDSITVGLAGILAGNKLGIPLVFTTHQLPGFISAYLPNFPGLRNGIEKALWAYCRWLVRYTDQFISPTATSARMVEKNTGFLPLVISNGMDLDQFRPQSMTPSERQFLCEKYGLDPARPIILHVGRLDFDKQVNLVIEASVKAIHHAEAQLFVVGDGSWNPRCRRA